MTRRDCGRLPRPTASSSSAPRAARAGRGLAAGAALSLAALTACGVPGVGGGGRPNADAVGVVTDVQAQRVLTRVLAADAAIRSGAPDAAARIPKAYAGEGARAARAAVLLISKGVQSKVTAAPTQVKVIANSRGPAYPRYLVGATTPNGGGLPVLHLLVASNAQTPYRLVLSAQILPGAQVNAFPGRDDGAEVVSDGGGLPTSPVALVQAYAKGLTTAQTNPPYDGDVFMDQVHTRAVAQKQAVAAEADFTQTNQMMPDPFVALRQLNGDVLVFGVIERSSNYAIKDGKQMVPTPYFSAFVPGRSVLVQEAKTTSLQFLVFSAPKSGRAHLVAATEQLVGAEGV